MTADAIKQETGSPAAADNLVDPASLSKIDQLFACGVGAYVQLPQLVVVGDQSSGKSSVLQAFIDLPFPRDSGLCTRFATQVIFRRAEEVRVSVSIIPSESASSEHAAKLKEWTRCDLKTINAHVFSDIMKEVHQLMGLRGGDSTLAQATFSEDVFRLEVSGPDKGHFSVVDVPGIFRKTTQGLTTSADQAMVFDIVSRYMKNPRSVILAVIPSNVDIVTQEILQLAENADPEGQRTMGVLTKPDLVDSGAEGSVIALLEGKQHALNLGWSIVRNPGQKQLEDPNFDRHATEKMFFQTKEPWNEIEKDKAGVESLRLRLQGVLAAHIRREFPKVKSEINRKINAANQALKSLGDKRDTPEEQRLYLMQISQQFQDVVGYALDANYVSACFEQRPDLKFATIVAERNDDFRSHIHTSGGVCALEGQPNQEPRGLDILEESEDLDTDDALFVRTTGNHEDIESILFENIIIQKVPHGDILVHLAKFYDNARGLRLGSFDNALLTLAMKWQSSKWEPLALGYISDVVSIAHLFILELLEFVCSDKRVRKALTTMLLPDLTTIYEAAFQATRYILEVERGCPPTTLDHRFSDNLEKSRQQRTRDTLKDQAWDAKGSGGHVRKVVALEAVAGHHPMSNRHHVIREFHDNLKAYYNIVKENFVDNVWKQAANYHLVSGPRTPLKLFSAHFVTSLSVEQLQEIAGEEPALKRKRAALQKQIHDLNVGKKILV